MDGALPRRATSTMPQGGHGSLLHTSVNSLKTISDSECTRQAVGVQLVAAGGDRHEPRPGPPDAPRHALCLFGQAATLFTTWCPISSHHAALSHRLIPVAHASSQHPANGFDIHSVECASSEALRPVCAAIAAASPRPFEHCFDVSAASLRLSAPSPAHAGAHLAAWMRRGRRALDRPVADVLAHRPASGDGVGASSAVAHLPPAAPEAAAPWHDAGAFTHRAPHGPHRMASSHR